MEQEAEFERDSFSPSAQDALAYAFLRSQTRAVRARQRQGALGTYDSALINAEDMLAAVSVTHGSDSPVRRLMEYYGVPFDNLNRALDLNAVRGANRFPDAASFGDDALDILNTSKSLARASRAKTDNDIHLRHLLGGVLWQENAGRALLENEFARANIPFSDVLTLYNKYLETDFEYQSFNDFLKKNPRAQTPNAPASPPPPTTTPPPQTNATTPPPTPTTPQTPPTATAPSNLFLFGFDMDGVEETREVEGKRVRVGQSDLVGIGSEVDAFAYLISAKTLIPPLAIGLFGNWGSGKSFFMQALQDRINQITLDARKDKQLQHDIYVYKRIVQIEFNAWHYVEGDLWASLVAHIFQNLRTSHDEMPTELQKRQRAVLERLKSEQDNLQAKQAELMQLERDKAQKEKELQDLKVERDLALQELNELKAQDVLAQIKLSDADKQQLNAKLKDFGVPQTMQTAAEFTEAIDELRATLTRGNALITPLRAKGPLWLIGLLVVIFSGPVVSFVMARFTELQIPALTNALLALSVFLSGLTVMVKLGTRQLANMIGEVEAAQEILDKKRREVEAAYKERLENKERDLIALQTQYTQAKSAEQQFANDIAKLEQELAAITPQSVLLDFIRARAGSEDYSKRLGLAALIRRDFEQLSQLIEDHNDTLKQENPTKPIDANLFNRIVLYIDDLDRCPPDRVVQVLQAVHLLLAFPLFVVVVAVDARWLSQSLEKHYGELLGGVAQNGNARAQADEDVATPRDYLEKIFQIPFWVRPLNDAARVRIVQGLLGPSLETETTQAQPDAKDPEKKIAPPPTAPKSHPRPEPQFDARQRQHQPNAPTDTKPPSLAITRAELAFIEGLQTLLGETPREIKRFVNLYRLLKAIALTNEPEFTEEKTFAEYKLVLLLLALMAGSPELSSQLLHRIKHNNFQPDTETILLSTVLEQLEKESTPTQPKRIAAPAQNAQAESPPAPSVSVAQNPQTELPVAQPSSAAQNVQAAQTAREIKRIQNWLATCEEGKWQTLALKSLAAWARQVERFSFQMELE